MGKVKAPPKVALIVSSAFLLVFTGLTIFLCILPAPWYGILVVACIDVFFLYNIIDCIRILIRKRKASLFSKTTIEDGEGDEEADN